MRADRLDFDVRKLKSFDKPIQFVKYCQKVGLDRFSEAWSELGKDPIEGAIACLRAGYCDSWAAFMAMSDDYCVSSATEPEGSGLNRKFRNRIKSEPELLQLVARLKEQEETKELEVCTR